MSDLISVIVPAYNAASRIKLTLESIIAQDYESIEIIAVDDSSTDGTGEIIREVLRESSRAFRVITHSHNRGVSSARNTGLEASQGKYVCFVDADDLLRVNFLSCLHAEISRGNHDIAFCGLTDRFTDGRKDCDMTFTRGLSRGAEGGNVIMNNTVPPFMCCMYSADFLRKNNLRFHEGCSSGEDVEFQMITFCMAGSVSFSDECPYIYMHHAEMGSLRDNNTREKKILRYEHNTQAQIRTAEYLISHSKSKSVKSLSAKILMPQSIIRRFNLEIMKHNRPEYNLLLKDKSAMKILRNAFCVYTLKNKPEVFMKAVMIMIMPGIYYRMRGE